MSKFTKHSKGQIFRFEKRHRYGIRKLSVGVASIAIATGLFVMREDSLAQISAQEVNIAEAGAQDKITAVEESYHEDAGTTEAETGNVVDQVLANGDSEKVDPADDLEVIPVSHQTGETDLPVQEEAHEDEVAEIYSADETTQGAEPESNATSLASSETMLATDQEETIQTQDSALEDASPLLMARAMNVTTPDATNQTQESEPIVEGNLRLHFKNLDPNQLSNLGLWLWGGVDPAAQGNRFPNDALSLEHAVATDYGYYIDIPVSGDQANIKYLLVNRTLTGDQAKITTEDQTIEVLSPQMKEVWIHDDYQLYNYRPLAEKGKIRVNYYSPDGNYDNLGLWVWGDTTAPSSQWPNGALDFVDDNVYGGKYVEVPLVENSQSLGFLVVNQQTNEQTANYLYTNLGQHSQIFIKAKDSSIYENPYYINHVVLEDANQTSEQEIKLQFASIDRLSESDALANIKVTDQKGNEIPISSLTLDPVSQQITIKGDFSLSNSPQYKVTYNEVEMTTRRDWRFTDSIYGYEGDLGVKLNQDGTAAMKVWSPSAEQVSLVLYDKNQPEMEIGRYAMVKGQGDQAGVWQIALDQSLTNIADLNGYYYHYEIKRGDETVLALDPYAPSLAAWQSGGNDKVAKAAIIDPSRIGPQLEFAQIPGFTKREDAIIYEVHVRDFTSDPNIANDLVSRFGTFSALVEKLDYVQQLGATHIQLLPVMSYYFADEFAAANRELDWSSKDNNYNWGYDPQSYFALSGMYSENPSDPEKRVAEFKALIDEIHRRGLGVIMDVVYNHTAQVHIFEDLEPNYYHFMDKTGEAKTSFGGGRLGTTHQMARRILVDSINYWVNEYKVDGFRFDMMGDHDAASIQEAYDKAKQINPNLIMIGEGWATYTGDDGERPQAADQSWMHLTGAVGVFSDEMRNEMKSGFGSEGQPMFLTGGDRNLWTIFNNIKANPNNFRADQPGDVVQYIEAHDNLTLYDVIAQSIKKDPDKHNDEILKRLRMGNAIILTSQGTAFLHAGQEYGRTKQFRSDTTEPPYKGTYMVDGQGNPFNYPYFIHDTYDASDMINRFEWDKVTDESEFAANVLAKDYTQGMIYLRRSTDAFRLEDRSTIDSNVLMITDPRYSQDVSENDLVIGYQTTATNGDQYGVFVNADTVERRIYFRDFFKHLGQGVVIVDGRQAGTNAIANPYGVELKEDYIVLAPLTTAVVAVRSEEESLSLKENLTVFQGEDLDYSTFFEQLPAGASLGQVVIPASSDNLGSTHALVEVVFADGSSRGVMVPIEVVSRERKVTIRHQDRRMNQIIPDTIINYQVGDSYLLSDEDIPEIEGYFVYSVSDNRQGQVMDDVLIKVTYMQETQIQPVSDQSKMISGTAEPGRDVYITINDQTFGPVRTDINGNWNFELADMQLKLGDRVQAKVIISSDFEVKSPERLVSGAWVPITPIPEVTVPSGTRVLKGSQIDYTSLLGLPEGAKVAVITEADTSSVGSKEAVVKVTFADGSSRTVTVPVTVYDQQPWTPITPIPEVTVPSDTRVLKGSQVDYASILSLPADASVTVLSAADTSSVGSKEGVVKVTFADGSSRTVTVPVTVYDQQPWTPITPIPEVTIPSDIRVLRGSQVDYASVLGIPEGAKVAVVTEVDTSSVGSKEGVVKVTFADGSSRTVTVPVTVYDQQPWTPITPIPEVTVPSDTRVLKGSQLDYASLLGLPEGAEVAVLTEVDTTSVGSKEAVVKVIFADGSSRTVTVPVTVYDQQPWTPITPIPEVTVPSDTRVLKGSQVDYGSILSLPADASVTVLTQVDTTSVGSKEGVVKVTFADGSSRTLTVPVTVY
ncbi:TPA: pullulanase, partial [Streptococcus suis]